MFICSFIALCNLYASIVTLILHNVFEIYGSDFLLLLGLFTFYPATNMAIKQYWNMLISKIPFVEIKEEHVLCKYMLIFSNLVCQEKISEEYRLLLIGMVKNHQQNCSFDSCVCKQKNGTSLFIPKNEGEYIIEHEKFSFENSKIYMKHLIIKEFEFLIKVTRNNVNVNLIMMFSYYMFFYIENFNSAYYVLINLRKSKYLNIQQKNSLNRIFEMTNHKLCAINSNPIHRINPNNNSTENFFMNFKFVLDYYNNVTDMKNTISEALDSSANFWTLIYSRSSINQIRKHGKMFYKDRKSVV